MSPQLATETQPAKSSNPTPLDDLLAELAIAEKWPTPASYCHRCGYDRCLYGAGSCLAMAEPPTLAKWGDTLAGRYERTLPMGDNPAHWSTGDAQLVREIAAALLRDADRSDHDR
jgi:hypothetical protein